MQRLCTLLKCPFDVPTPKRVLIDRASLVETVTTTTDDSSLDLDDLQWATTDHGDVVEAVVLDDDDRTPFPIADDHRYRPWLEARELTTDEVIDIWELTGRYGDSPRAVATEVVRGLSAMMSVDFLTNNWTRIPTDDRVTTVISGPRLGSTHHTSAFARRSSKRVSGRFGWVRRFDRELVVRLHMLDRETADGILFAHGDIAEARSDEFWSQREELLEAVEDAEKEAGEATWLP